MYIIPFGIDSEIYGDIANPVLQYKIRLEFLKSTAPFLSVKEDLWKYIECLGVV